jgi:hypothetical protein
MKLLVAVVVFWTLSGGLSGQTPPDGRIISSREVGRMSSGTSRAVVTALELEDAAAHGRLRRGVRIDFFEDRWHWSVFLEEGVLEREAAEFEKLAPDADRAPLSKGRSLAFIGSCEFRDNPDAYPLTASFQYSGGGAPALWVFADGHKTMFSGRTPEDLAKLLGAALDPLRVAGAR